MNELTLRVAAKSLIIYEAKILLVREGAPDGTQIGSYQIPGGMVEIGEDFMDALRREAKEETGLEIEPIAPIAVDGWKPIISGIPHQIIAIFYLCRANSNQVQLSHEHDDFVWIDPKDLSKYNVPEPVPQVIKKYQQLKSSFRLS